MIFGGSDADWPRSYFFVGQRSAVLMFGLARMQRAVSDGGYTILNRIRISATPCWKQSRLKSVLRRNLPRKSLGQNLSVLHDEGVGADFEAIVCCLGRPHDVGGVAGDLLPQQLEGHPRLLELLEQHREESSNCLGAAQQAIGGKKPRRVGVVGHGAGEIELPEAL